MSRVFDVLDSLDERLGFHRAKLIAFEIEGKPAVLAREWWTGRLTLSVDGQVVELRRRFERPLFTLRSFWSWSCELLGHKVVVEMRSRVPFAAFRPVAYRILVDGVL